MNPETVRIWQRIARDTLIVVVGAFMLIYETVFARQPDPTVIAAALGCFALPPALRFRNGDSKEEDH